MSKKYCDWALKSELEKKYHDEEWGKPVFDDKKFFEMLVLEYMQAGLSWQTILQKREAMRAAFDDFDAEKSCSKILILFEIASKSKHSHTMQKFFLKFSENLEVFLSTFGHSRIRKLFLEITKKSAIYHPRPNFLSKLQKISKNVVSNFLGRQAYMHFCKVREL